MKKLLLLLLCVPLIGFGQTENIEKKEFKYFDKKSNLVGLNSLSVGWGAGSFIGAIDVSYGKFIIPNICLGVSAGYNHISGYSEYSGISADAFIRYYILEKKISPFLETRYNIFNYDSGSSLLLSGGAVIRLWKVISLGAAAGYSYDISSRTNQFRWYPILNYHF